MPSMLVTWDVCQLSKSSLNVCWLAKRLEKSVIWSTHQFPIPVDVESAKYVVMACCNCSFEVKQPCWAFVWAEEAEIRRRTCVSDEIEQEPIALGLFYVYVPARNSNDTVRFTSRERKE